MALCGILGSVDKFTSVLSQMSYSCCFILCLLLSSLTVRGKDERTDDILEISNLILAMEVGAVRDEAKSVL